MDLYEDLILEVLLSDVSTKGWREFEKKYLPLAGRGDLFCQFTNFASSTEDKRLVGTLAKPEYDRLGSPPPQDLKAITQKQAVPDVTLWVRPTHSDPTAIYTYPLEYVVHHPMDLRYGFPSRFLRVIKLKPGVKVLDLQSITKESAIGLLQQMGIELPQGWSWENYWKMGAEYAKTAFSGTPITAPKVFFYLVQHEFEWINPADDDPFPRGLDNNEQRARFVKARIGVVQDTAKGRNDAVVHFNEPEQAFFMQRGDFEIVDAYRIGGREENEKKELEELPSNYQPSVIPDIRHIIMKTAARLLQSIDQRDQVVGFKQLHGGYEIVTNPLPTSGHITVDYKEIAFTKRGRVITANVQGTGRGSEHRSGGRHIPFEIDLSLDSEAGHQATKISKEDELSDGVARLASEYRKAKPDSEWKPFRGVNPNAEAWRELLHYLSMVNKSTIDLDALKQAAPMVCERLAELFSLVGWHWKPPQDVWKQIASWHVACTIYKEWKRMDHLTLEGLKTVSDRFIKDLEDGDRTYPLHPSALKRLKNTSVGEAAYSLAEGFGNTKPSSEIMSVAWGMQHFFLKRFIVAMEGAYPNFREDIAKDISKLIANSQPEAYKKELKWKWDNMANVDRRDMKDTATTNGRFYRATGEHPDPAWLMKSVNEDIKAIDTQLTKEQIRSAVADVRGLLSQNGLDPAFTVKLRPTDNKRWVAQYRSGSAFRGRPIFWINPEMGKTLFDKFGSGYYNQRDFDYAIIRNLMDTLVHEYGHAVADVIKLNFRKAGSPFNGLNFGQEVNQDEEDFAEHEFSQALFDKTFMKQPWAKFYFGKEDINEVIVARPDSVGTATGLQLGSKEVWRNPSKQAAFISPQKQLPQTHNRYIASAKRTIERAVQRTLTWVRDPSTKSETAYIGHGRKVRVGFDNPSLSPMTIKFNAKHMPPVEKVKAALT